MIRELRLEGLLDYEIAARMGLSTDAIWSAFVRMRRRGDAVPPTNYVPRHSGRWVA
jgi:DNA-directed RNA polymerase specialized sigma24 family protein